MSVPPLPKLTEIRARDTGDRPCSSERMWQVSQLGSPGPAFTMLPRRESHLRPKTPGPGSYSPENVTIRNYAAPQYTLGQRRKAPRTERMPGPNQYSTETSVNFTRCQSPSYTMRKRLDVKPSNTSPGPQYMLPDFLHDPVRQKSLAFSFGTKFHRRVSSTGPGPGAHNLPVVIGSGRSVGIGKKFDNPQEVKSTTPGPGSYVRNEDFWLSRGPKWTMVPRRVMKENTGRSPGPKYYPTDPLGHIR